MTLWSIGIMGNDLESFRSFGQVLGHFCMHGKILFRTENAARRGFGRGAFPSLHSRLFPTILAFCENWRTRRVLLEERGAFYPFWGFGP